MNQDLEYYTNAIALLIDQANNYVRDGQGNPPWSQAMSPDTVRNDGIAWLGQMVGVAPEIQSQFESDDSFYARQRQRVRSHLGFARGSATSMLAAAELHLIGSKTVIFRERDGSPYHLTVVTRTAETPDPEAVRRELMALKPAGIVLDYHTITGRDFAEVRDDNADFAAAETAYGTFAGMRGY